MDKKITTFGMNPEKLARLLNIGSDNKQAETKLDEDEIKAELLLDRLAETLRLDPSTRKTLPKNLGQLCDTIGALAAEPIRNLLQDPKTDIVLIRKIKDHGKKLSQTAKAEAEHQVANTIYYAAIAYALVFHNLKITTFSYKDLGQSFSLLSKEVWIAEGFQSLFAKASEYCQGKKTSKCR